MSVKIPMVLKNDRQVFQACIKTCNRLDKENVTVARIKNTVALDEIAVSENLIPLVKENKFMEVVSAPAALPFDGAGNIL